MCGINGIIYFDANRFVDLQTLKQMNSKLIHRGPDDEGVFINRNVGFGFRRLSIIDIAHGKQPMKCEKTSNVIVFNGEIYNYIELKSILESKGYTFHSQSDTEVILHLYSEYGLNCLKFLRGMFAFAIWDEKKQKLFCARDRFGIKPFYYYIDDEKFVFSSEIQSILKAGNINTDLSLDALDSFFAFGYITGNLSIYSKIIKLQPGNFLEIDKSLIPRIKTQKYWEIFFEPDYTKEEKYWEEEIRECFFEAVKLHMISDVPIGSFLSGGVDSSSITAIMSLISNEPIKTFTIGYMESKYNELKYAHEVANLYKCDYHEQYINENSIQVLNDIVAIYNEPYADSSAIPTYFVSKFAKEFVTVILSGDGCDELFSGYDIYKFINNISRFQTSSPKINKLFWGNISKLLPFNFPGKRVSNLLSKDNIGAYINIWNQDERWKLYKNNFSDNRRFNDAESIKIEILGTTKFTDIISGMQYMDMKTYLPDDIFTKVDRASMKNSLEVRVPFLDHKFAELSYKIPIEFKYKFNHGKYIFKKAMSPYLPSSILYRKKQGFEIPISIWFKNNLNKYLKDIIYSSNEPMYSYLNQDYVRKYFLAFLKSEKDLSPKIWTILVFNEWLKQNEKIEGKKSYNWE